MSPIGSRLPWVEYVAATALSLGLGVALVVSPTAACNALVICMPTPLTGAGEPDLTYLLEAGTAISQVLQPEQLVVLESTIYPGTTRERLAPILEESGLAAGRDFHLAFSPERIDPGRTDYTTRTTPKLVGDAYLRQNAAA
jgi:UDP-N-acetyl-D-glucosamine dehydrogenase